MKSYLSSTSRMGWYFLVLCIVAFFPGCQLNGPAQPVSSATTSFPQMDGEDGCDDLGTSYHFEFDVTPIPNNNPGDYLAQLITPPYTTQECMCQVESYTITFGDLNPNEVVLVTDETLEPLNPYPTITSSQQQGGTSIIIDDFTNFEDENLTVVVFLEERAAPSSADGGGLCVIDNVGGLGDSLVGINMWTPLLVSTQAATSVFIPSPNP